MISGGIFKTSNIVFELVKGIVVFIILLVLIHFFVATIFKVEGASMEPNFHQDQYAAAYGGLLRLDFPLKSAHCSQE